MAYRSETISAVAMTFATAPRHAKIVMTGIKIHNIDTVKRVITLTDTFTTDDAVVASSGAAYVGIAVTEQVLTVEVATLESFDIPETELKDFKILGALKVACDVVTTTGPTVSIGYHLE